MKRLIKNTQEGGLGTYVGPTGGEREHILFTGSLVTEIEDAKLKEALSDPVVASWFKDGLLVEQTPQVAAKAPEPAKPEAKKDDGKK